MNSEDETTEREVTEDAAPYEGFNEPSVEEDIAEATNAWPRDFNEEAQDLTTEELHFEETFREAPGQKIAGPPTSRARPTISRQVMSGSDGARMGLLEKAVIRQAIDLVAYEGIAEDAIQQEVSMQEQLILIAQERDQALNRLAKAREETDQVRATLHSTNRLAKERAGIIGDLRNEIDAIRSSLEEQRVLIERLREETGEFVVDPATLPAPEDPDEVVPEKVDVPEAQEVVDEVTDDGPALARIMNEYAVGNFVLALEDGRGQKLHIGSGRIRVVPKSFTPRPIDEPQLLPLAFPSMLVHMRVGQKFSDITVYVDAVKKGEEHEDDAFVTGDAIHGSIKRNPEGWAVSGPLARHVVLVNRHYISSMREDDGFIFPVTSPEGDDI